MSYSQQRARRRATLISAVIGLIIIFTFVISLIVPDLGSRANTTTNDIDVFATPRPTSVIIPTPEPNPQLDGEPLYIHSSGLFQTFWPAGADWVSSESENAETSIASVVIQSGARLAVIHTYIRFDVQYGTPDSLSRDFLTEGYFVEAWSQYQSWEETGRALTDDSVIVNFDLVSDQNEYLGRDITRTTDGWLYIARLVVPANNPALLDLLQEKVVASFDGYHQLTTIPVFWRAYIDQQLGFLIKYPFTWELVAGDNGRPVTFNIPASDDKMIARVWTVPNHAVSSAEEAQAWLIETEPTATVGQIEPLEFDLGAGYQIGYTYRDTAGDAHSGLMVMISDSADTLFVANLQAPSPNINWLDAASLSQQDNETQQALVKGLMILPLAARLPATPE
jgi:hypothetical protein